ncbi:MAG TPA: GTPase Era [Gemmatimonadales bacterium]
MPEPSVERFATVVLAGRPNAGKSTLLNALIGQKLAIVSDKPQSTRMPIVGLWTSDHVQVAFVDPAGLFEPRYLMHDAMLGAARSALEGADLILYLHPLAERPVPPLADLLPADTRLRAPVLTVLTQADRAGSVPRDLGPDTIVVSAKTGLGLDALLGWCRDAAPEGPFRHDPEDMSTQPVRFFAAELVREAAFGLLRDEVPYAIAVEVDEFRETTDPVYIRMTLHVERESQKRLVIGRGGAGVKAIGSTARTGIESLIGARVYLDLRVRVTPKWRKSPGALSRLGFPLSTRGGP